MDDERISTVLLSPTKFLVNDYFHLYNFHPLNTTIDTFEMCNPDSLEFLSLKHTIEFLNKTKIAVQISGY